MISGGKGDIDVDAGIVSALLVIRRNEGHLVRALLLGPRRGHLHGALASV